MTFIICNQHKLGHNQRHQRQTMTDNAALVAAITALMNAVALIIPPPLLAQVFEPLISNVPFNLSTGAGLIVYRTIDGAWDGSVAIFPSFVFTHALQASKSK